MKSNTKKRRILALISAFALLIVCSCAMFRGQQSESINGVMTASAAELPADYKVYESYNLLIQPYNFEPGNKSGVDVVVNDDYSITLNGTATSQVTLSFFNPTSLPGGLNLYGFDSFYFSGINSLPSNCFVQYYVSGRFGGNINTAGRSVTFSNSSDVLTNFFLVIPASTTINNVTIYPMLNGGTEKSLYQPYFRVFYDESYDAGYNQNIESSGYFADSWINVVLIPKNGVGYKYLYDIQPTYINNEGLYGISFQSTVIQTIESLDPEDSFYNYDYRISVIFGHSRPLAAVSFKDPTHNRLTFFNDSTITAYGSLTRDGVSETYDTPLTPDSYYTNTLRMVPLIPGYVDPTFDPWVNSIDFNVTSAVFFAMSTIELYQFPGYYGDYSSDNSYDAGYDRGYEEGRTTGYGEGLNYGYNQGYSDGDAEGYLNGFDDGYADGKVAGYDEGYENGVSTKDDFGFFDLFFAAVDAPVAVMTDMFSFEILGIDLKAFIISLLSIAILIAVVRLFV